MSPILIVILLLLVAGGGYGWRSGLLGRGFVGLGLAAVLLVLMVMLVLGRA